MHRICDQDFDPCNYSDLIFPPSSNSVHLYLKSQDISFLSCKALLVGTLNVLVKSMAAYPLFSLHLVMSHIYVMLEGPLLRWTIVTCFDTYGAAVSFFCPV